jgi:deazaflavin-dependent oxidoreductase (nitroreductase family)
MAAGDNVFDRLRFLRRVSAPTEAAFTRRFGRTPLSVLFGVPTLLLETTGRRSGQARRTTLAYYREDDGSVLVVAGAGGQTRVPDWVANLRAQPEATVTLERQRTHMVATELTGEDRAAAWARLVQDTPRIEAYERRAGRAVPVFRLQQPSTVPGRAGQP